MTTGLSSAINPGLILILAAVLVPVLPGSVRRPYVLLVPAAAFVVTLMLDAGALWPVAFMGMELELLRVDRLSRIFALIFLIAA